MQTVIFYMILAFIRGKFKKLLKPLSWRTSVIFLRKQAVKVLIMLSLLVVDVVFVIQSFAGVISVYFTFFYLNNKELYNFNLINYNIIYVQEHSNKKITIKQL